MLELGIWLYPTVASIVSWLLLTPSFGQLGAVTNCLSAGCTDDKAVSDIDWFNVSFKLTGRLGIKETDCWTDAPHLFCNGWLDATPKLNNQR